eukprot:TRINITY_DN480_c0_g1_i1.p1 TRINITY_DN480_c0_g1~~TRINITY_DN480_c0_g1_i1.p1  ORF type:complete len:1110 (+),score=307.63 TRINITY_DN480_c0_g1_i1:269-3331(+)
MEETRTPRLLMDFVASKAGREDSSKVTQTPHSSSPSVKKSPSQPTTSQPTTSQPTTTRQPASVTPTSTRATIGRGLEAEVRGRPKRSLPKLAPRTSSQSSQSSQFSESSVASSGVAGTETRRPFVPLGSSTPSRSLPRPPVLASQSSTTPSRTRRFERSTPKQQQAAQMSGRSAREEIAFGTPASPGSAGFHTPLSHAHTESASRLSIASSLPDESFYNGDDDDGEEEKEEYVEDEGDIEERRVAAARGQSELDASRSTFAREYADDMSQFDEGVDYSHVRPVDVPDGPTLREMRQEYVENLIHDFNVKTRGSKIWAQYYRSALVDSRNTSGFRPPTKELVYPIVGDRGQGCKFFDIDGNEYVDVSMGFGVTLLGHAPECVMESIRDELDRGMVLGPQKRLAGKVSNLVCGLSGYSRCVFVNSGTEAVMVAIRLGRLATKKKAIVMFRNSYHGMYDGTLARPGPAVGTRSLAGIAAGMKDEDDLADEVLKVYASIGFVDGVPSDMHANTILLDYGDWKSLEIIEAAGSRVAAVIVEPIQSRKPYLQPRKFLHALRAITKKKDIALIFDECVTGFRLCVGGAQEFFGVRADMSVFGKVIGGGLPIGVIAGHKRFMDGVDGGTWAFGDDSYPTNPTTFFAGTFNKHPLTMAASLGLLKELKRDRTLYDRINAKTKDFVDRMNSWLVGGWYPCRLVHIASLWRIIFTSEMSPVVDIFYYRMNMEGVYMWEGRNFFMCAAHTPEDVAFVERTMKSVLEDMRSHGLFGVDLPAFELCPADGPSYAPAVVLQSAGDRIPYFLVHPGIRSVLGYLTFAQVWGKTQPLIAFGEDAGEEEGGADPLKEPKSVQELAGRYLACMREIQPTGPYIVGGWSFGGCIALEIAQMIEESGDDCVSVHMFDQNAPQFPLFDESSSVEMFHGELSKAQGANVGDKGYMHLSTAKDLEIAYHMRHVLERTPITLFRAAELMSNQHPPDDPAYGLASCSTFPVRVVSVPGDHVSMFSHPHVETLVKCVKDELKERMRF